MKHDHITHRIYIKPETPARDPHMRTTATSGHVGARCQEQDAGVRPTARPRTPRHRRWRPPVRRRPVLGESDTSRTPPSPRTVLGRHPGAGGHDRAFAVGVARRSPVGCAWCAPAAHADTDGMEASYLVKTQVHKQAPTNTLQCLLACLHCACVLSVVEI